MASRSQERVVVFGLQAQQIQNIGAWLLLEDLRQKVSFVIDGLSRGDSMVFKNIEKVMGLQEPAGRDNVLSIE